MMIPYAIAYHARTYIHNQFGNFYQDAQNVVNGLEVDLSIRRIVRQCINSENVEDEHI